jgi:2-polyprenyl-3-methyl-5-hydroxy-6-metoxy-1,4-benzoquinol methylase
MGRRGVIEWLDAGGLSADEVGANLRDMEVLNRRFGGSACLLPYAREMLDAAPPRGEVRVLDIACGGGDVLRVLVREARRREVTLQGVGVDANPQVLAHARAEARDFPELTWVRAEAQGLPFARQSFDLVLCATFLHHLTPEASAALLSQAVLLARGRVIVSDLRRAAVAPLAFSVLARLLRLHPVTRRDGTLSLQQAYSARELARLAARAGVRGWHVRTHAGYRMTLVCEPFAASSGGDAKV